METFFGAGEGDNSSLTGSRGGVDGQLSGKCTLVRSGAKIDGEMLSVDIASSTSLSMPSGEGDMLSIMVRSLGEKSSIKSTS